jgi:hypothetical protein
MNVIELERALRQLAVRGMAAVLETRLVRPRLKRWLHRPDLVLVSDELTRRADRLPSAGATGGSRSDKTLTT